MSNFFFIYNVVNYGNDIYPDIKQKIIISDEEIKTHISTLYLFNAELKRNALDNNIINIYRDGNIYGYALIAHEIIPCPYCTNVDYLLFTDKSFYIKKILIYNDVIENSKMVKTEYISKIIKKYEGKSLRNHNFSSIIPEAFPVSYSYYFKKSILKLQKKARVLEQLD